MPITTYSNDYYDDFSVEDINGKTPDDKNYLRILIKPGYAIQVRELNQMQSILQSQIDKFGQSVWVDGAAVIGGNANFDDNISSINVVASTGTALTDASVDTLRSINDSASGLSADVIGWKFESSGTYTLYIRYKNSAVIGDVNISVFPDDTVCNTTGTSDVTISVNSSGYAAGIFLDAGVFFTKGSFVATPTQSVFIDKTLSTTAINGFGKLQITESIINYIDDSTLLDNANGSLNNTAPGADRYAIDLSLVFLDSAAVVPDSDDNTIRLITIVNSKIVEVSRNRYSSLDRELAKRTFEESGNYTLSPFKLEIRELLKDNSNFKQGRYEASQLESVGIVGTISPAVTASEIAQDKYYAGLNPSVAYVNGYRIEPPSKTELYADKARTNNLSFVNSNVYANIGNYCVGSFSSGSYLPDISSSNTTYEVGINKTIIGNTNLVRTDDGILKLDNVDDLSIGMPVTGSIFPVGTTIVSINRSDNTITVSEPLVVPAAVTADVEHRTETSIATISEPNHGLVTGNIIYVTTAYSTTIPIGTYVVTVIGPDTFTIVTNNTTAISGGGHQIAYRAIPANTVGSFVGGTVKIKAIETEGVVDGIQNYRFYLYDNIITAPNGFNLSFISYIKSATGSDVNINVNVPITAISENTNVFKLPYDAIKEVQNVVYDSLSYFSGNTGTAGVITLPLGGKTADLSPSSYMVNVAGTIYTPTTITGTTTITLTTDGTAWAASSGLAYRVIAQTQVSGTSPITITLQPIADEEKLGDTATDNVFTLSKARIFEPSLGVKYGTVGGADVTSDFTIVDDGQRDNYYTNVKVRYNGSKNLVVGDKFYFTFKYFDHGTSTGFATVDSYSLIGDNATAGLTYGNIPSYDGVRLTDVIDFRQIILNLTTPSLQTLNPYSIIQSDAKYYLPRIDKVVVSSDGTFSIVQGVAALNPIEPVTPINSMSLYTLNVPAYTYSIEDIGVNYINNRRYTMSDIGSLDRRISNVEYYTTLSLLEKSANEKPISDVIETRFKNGIIVDAFVDFDTSDSTNAAYKASIDISNGTLRPQYNTTRIDFKPVASAGIAINKNTATLAYEETQYVNQRFASETESVNPYDIATYIGTMVLSPSSDEWQETEKDITELFDPNTLNVLLAQKAKIKLGNIWGKWARDARIPGTRRTRTRTGINRTLEILDVSEETLNDIDITIIPFVRSRKIYFSASGLKPNTRVYPFFDGFDVSAYVNTTSYVEFKNATEVATYTGQTAGQAGVTSTSCVTNVAGEVQGMLLIPNNDELRFKTGVREFKLTDSLSNNFDLETTYAAANYTASGTTKTISATVTTTRTPTLVDRNITQTRRWKDPVAQSFLIDERSPSGVFLTSVDLYFAQRSETLPINLSIVTMENGYPSQNVIPFSSVTLNPYTIDDDGGYVIKIPDPDQDELPASVPTNFKFSDPVYLSPGQEYALVLTSNDSAYRIWTSKVGGKDVTDNAKFIEKNPYAGVMFMSANSSTWTADQTRDFKFNLNRASFKGKLVDGNPTLAATAGFKPNISTGVQSVTIGTAGSGYTVALAPTVTFAAPVSGVTATGTAVIDTVTGSVTSVNITNPGSGYTAAPTVTFAAPVSGVTATGTVGMVNIPISTLNLTQNNIEPYSKGTDNSSAATSIFNTLTLASGLVFNVAPDENYNLTTDYAITLANKNAIGLTTDFSSNNDYISPLIDLDNVSLLAVSNIIDPVASLYDGATDTETLADAGNGLSRYITTTVNLNQPADRLTVFVDVNRPTPGSYIKVYAKLQQDSASNIWYEMIPKNGTIAAPQNGIPVSADSTTFSEVEYTYKSTNNDFVAFAVKIVFVSDEIYTPTTVKNFRAIATSGIQ